MRLQTVFVPDAADGGFAHGHRTRHAASAPMGGIRGLLLSGLFDDHPNLLWSKDGSTSGLLFQNRCHLFPEILDYVRPADPPLLAFGGVIDMDDRDFLGQALHG